MLKYKQLYFLIILFIIFTGCIGPIINTPKVTPEKQTSIGLGLSYMLIPEYTFRYYDSTTKTYKDTFITNQSWGVPTLSLGMGITKNAEVSVESYGILDSYIKGKIQITEEPLLSSVSLGIGFPSAYVGFSFGGYLGKTFHPYGGVNFGVWYYGFAEEGIKAPFFPSIFTGFMLCPTKNASFIFQLSYFPPFSIYPFVVEDKFGKGAGIGITAGMSIYLGKDFTEKFVEKFADKLIDKTLDRVIGKGGCCAW